MATDMTNEQRVCAVYPNATLGPAGWDWIIRQYSKEKLGFYGLTLGSGGTEEAAWADASRRLPAPTAEPRTVICTDTSHMGGTTMHACCSGWSDGTAKTAEPQRIPTVTPDIQTAKATHSTEICGGIAILDAAYSLHGKRR